MIQPMNGRIFVKLDEAENRTAGGLILPEISLVPPRVGIVTASDDAAIEVGAHVVLSPCTGMTFRWDNVNFVIIGNEDIVAAITEDV